MYSQTHSWDVRTKHVTCDSIPTLEHVKGLAVYGPGATLFTLGPNGTVQQFDLNSPAIMVANVQHPVNPLPPSPPNSIEEPGVKSAHSATTINTSASESDLSSIPVGETVSESDEDHLSPFQRITRHQDISSTDASNEMIESPASSRSGMSSLSRSSAGSGTPRRVPGSAISRGMSDHTYISAGSSVRTSTVGRKDMDTLSMGYTMPSSSFASQSSTRSRQRPSRLRNEVPRSPDDNKVHDLFMYTRARLTDIPYKHPASSDFSRLTNDHLRRQMLSTIFGWHKEVDDLIRDEMSRHPIGSTTRILLAKWLGDFDADGMVADSKNMSSSDWMLLALSGIGGQASQHKLGRTYVSRLLESGDIHAAVTIMLGMGDFNDAIEAYMAHKRYMEALILTCLEFPSVWERQAAIVRKWGEWAVQHNRQQLAIRCFACTDMESTEPWTSPSAQQLNFQNINASIPEILSPPLSPPGVQRGPQRSIAKSSALKLITTFGDQSKKSKFYSQGDGGQTPLAAGVTPIAESAVSPGGFEAATAFLRPSNNSRFNTPTSASVMSSRGRLPSIGEIPSDLNRDALRSEVRADRSEHRRGHGRRASSGQDNLAEGLSLQRAATASPMMMRDFQGATRARDATHGEAPPSPDKNVMAMMEKGDFARRNGSRDRMPQGLRLNLAPEEDTEIISPEQSVSSSTRFHWPTRRRGPGSVSSSVTSSSAGRSLRGRVRHPDDYIHSLDAASTFKATRKAHSSRERAAAGRQASRERRTVKSRETSEDRGRSSARMWHKPKRSPTSPVPMSPEDIANLSNPLFTDANEPRTVRKSSVVKRKTGSRTSSRGSRRQSPDARPAPLDLRGRSKDRDGNARQRSPSSPLPMSATAMHYAGSEDDEDFKKAMQAQEEFRAKHSRSATRGLNSPIVTKMEHSQARHKGAVEAAGGLPPLPTIQNRTASTGQAGDLRRIKEERLRKKEQAARELEERRQSLAQRGLATPIPPPNQGQGFPRLGVETSNPESNADLPPRSATTSPPRSMYARGGPQLGLPATPKAMRLIIEGDPNIRVSQAMPEVPTIPAQYVQQPQQPATEVKPQAHAAEPELLTLLPSTVYQPPVRPPPRSMSAPIPDDPSKGRVGRKSSTGDVKPILERIPDDEMMLPPPPPAPPMLKELQHLAIPPPPPPAPLPNAQRSQQNAALSSGMIEIVMDDEEAPAPVAVAAPNDNMVPVLSQPAPPHSRGRSIGDGSSIANTFAKAKDRLRSGSRGRKEPARNPGKESPYESVPNTQLQPTIRSPPPVMYDQDALRTPMGIDSKLNKHMSTGLHQSEMF